jgi:hypothetical protein
MQQERTSAYRDKCRYHSLVHSQCCVFATNMFASYKEAILSANEVG